MRTTTNALRIVLLAGALLACEDHPKGAAPASSASASATPAPTASASAASAASAPASAAPVASAPAAPPESVAAQHVLVAFKGAKNAPKSITRSRIEAKKRAEEVTSKALEGADFSALVAEYSDDAATKDRQGSLGKFKREAMVGPFADAAFALPVGGVSKPVETPFGFHVIKRNQ